jgi:hypothetical protein
MFANRIASWARLALAAAVGLALAAPSRPAAKAPAQRDCGDAATVDPYTRLACRQEAIAAQLAYTADTAFGTDTRLHGKTSPARLAHVKNGKNASAHVAAVHKKESFKRHARTEVLSGAGGGHLVPLDPAVDDVEPKDGICDFEQGIAKARCAAVDPGPNGELQACNPEKKSKGKGGLECDRFLDDEDPASAAAMDEAANALDATYESTERSLVEMNDALDLVNASPPLQARVAATPDPCALPDQSTGLSIAVPILRVTATSLDGAARIAESATGQDAMGFNAQAVAVAFDVAWLVADLSATIAEQMQAEESSAVQDAIMSCVMATAGDVAQLATEIADVKAKMQLQHAQIMLNDNTNTAELLHQLEQARREIVDLLNTPQGQRALFPVK